MRWPSAASSGISPTSARGQLNVQVPWELHGQTAAQVKVSVGDSHGLVYAMPVGAYSPALFARDKKYRGGAR